MLLDGISQCVEQRKGNAQESFVLSFDENPDQVHNIVADQEAVIYEFAVPDDAFVLVT
jgi:hypothetical protein